MSYPGTLTKEMEARIKEEIDYLSSLSEGQVLTISGSPEVLSKKRTALYAWFHLTGIKSFFRIKSIGRNTLVVEKRSGLRDSSAKLWVTPANIEDFVRDHLEEFLNLSKTLAREKLLDLLPPHRVEEALALLLRQGIVQEDLENHPK